MLVICKLHLHIMRTKVRSVLMFVYRWTAVQVFLDAGEAMNRALD